MFSNFNLKRFISIFFIIFLSLIIFFFIALSNADNGGNAFTEAIFKILAFPGFFLFKKYLLSGRLFLLFGFLLNTAFNAFIIERIFYWISNRSKGEN
jgi:hypothetical protein